MIKSILIVGGGSSGWITANLLNAKLNQDSDCNITITLIESPNIPKIGVGEATIPNIRQTLFDIGVDEQEFMRATDATFKTQIRFVNWRKNSYFDHPFDRCLPNESVENVKAWLYENPQTTDKNEFAEAFSLLTHLSNNHCAPKTNAMESFESPFPYAFHLDALKLATYLTKHGTKHGIKHYLANVTQVDVNENGNITSVKTDTDMSHSADLYIDCTGMRSLLHKKALKNTYHDYSKYMLCDIAVAMNIPYETYKPEHLNPYTTATAMPSGWIWDIVLQNRRGIGHVYSSAFETSELAEKRLRDHEGLHAKKLNAQHIKFKTHRSKAAWSTNCVAIGLSGGFLEPLESSGIYLIEYAAKTLAHLIPETDEDYTSSARHFNTKMKQIYEEVLEYLNIHYCLSNRDDSEFWKEVVKPEHILPSLQKKLELWKTTPPSQVDFDHTLQLFPIASFEYILFGMGYKPKLTEKGCGKTPDLSKVIDHSLQNLPPHETFIKNLYN